MSTRKSRLTQGRVHPARLWCAAAALAFCIDAHAADIRLNSAWARPMAGGDVAVPLYVDIRTDAPVTLVGASSVAAKSVAIVLVKLNADGSETASETDRIDIPAGEPFRFALNADRLELRGVRAEKMSGMKIPIELRFVDAAGTKSVVMTDAVVRGIFPSLLKLPERTTAPAAGDQAATPPK